MQYYPNSHYLHSRSPLRATATYASRDAAMLSTDSDKKKSEFSLAKLWTLRILMPPQNEYQFS